MVVHASEAQAFDSGSEFAMFGAEPGLLAARGQRDCAVPEAALLAYGISSTPTIMLLALTPGPPE